MDKKSLFIHAPNIRHGGGLLLMEQLLNSVSDKNLDIGGCFASNIKFKNYKIPYPKKSIKLYSSSLLNYFYSNIHLYKSRNSHSVFLYFGNLPPFIKTEGFSVLFLHSKLLVEPLFRYKLNLIAKLNLLIRKLLLKIFHKNVDLIIVQTPSMKKLTQDFMPRTSTIMYPFYNPRTFISGKDISYDFLYPSFGYAYKNYDNLLKALVLLSRKDIFPKFVIALDPNIDEILINKISKLKNKYQLKIDLLLNPPFSKILDLYEQSRCLIWPSLTESLGIPILDAVYANKDIIASDLEYINDLLDLPEDRKFDPNDVSSIARTIQKYLENNGGQSSPPKLRFKIFNSGEFVEKLMSLKRV